MTDLKIYEARKLLCKHLASLAKEKNISHETIAEKTGFSRSNVSRMLSAKYSPTLDNFMKICEAIDVYFFIIDKDSKDDLVKTMKNRWGKSSPSWCPFYFPTFIILLCHANDYFV